MRVVVCVALTLALGCEYRDAGLDPNTDAGKTSTDAVSVDIPFLPDAAPLDVAADLTADGPLDGETGSTSTCGLHQVSCGGDCIPVSLDPDNCGSCGIVCGSGQACAGGACSSTCPPGLVSCGRTCVDTWTSNDHCGACLGACAVGTGCVEGTCRPATSIVPVPTCPPLAATVPLGEDLAGPCAGDIARTVFRRALCTCGDLNAGQGLFADAFASVVAPYTADAADRRGASVGLNGTLTAGSAIELWGDLQASSPEGISVGQEVTVKQDLRLGGKLKASRLFTVGGDGWVNGDVTAGAAVAFAGTLHVPDGAKLSAGIACASLERAPVYVPPPCDCGAANLVPIAAAVEWARLHNDNGVAGLAPDLLIAPPAPVRLDLTCGRYYLTGIGGPANVTIAVHGRVLLFVGGDVQPSGSLRIAVDAAAELDVFVAGSMVPSRPFVIGSPVSPALIRVYIQGPSGQDALRIPSGSVLGGFFYAASGQVTASGSLQLFGGIFAGDFRSGGKTTIHYDRAVLSAGDVCPGN